MGELQPAIREVNRALALNPAYAPSLALAAQLYLAAKDYPAAIDHAKLGLDATPGAWQLAVLKSEAEWAADRQADAVATIQAAIQRHPDLPDARRQLVNLQTRGKQYEAALATCRAAREKFKDDVPLMVQETVLLDVLGQSEASQTLAKQLLGEPADAGRALLLANAFSQLQRTAAARRYAEAALAVAKDREKPAIHQFLGNLALSENATNPDRKLLEAARDHFAEVLKAVPNDFVAGNNLAWLLAVNFNQATDAVAIAERVRGDTPSARLPVTFVDTLATVYRRAGRPEKALPLLEESLAANPNQPLIKFHLGMTLSQLGQRRRLDEARQLLQESLGGALPPEQATEAKQEVQKIEHALQVAAQAANLEAEAKAAAARSAAAKRDAVKATPPGPGT
jgi:tetratricopeptide (TPR) repeat protein